jgi:hypothetical protein
MKRRGVADSEQIIHFTQLSEVVDVISANFSLFAPRLGLKRKAFHALVGPILKGRTEEAHNRPDMFGRRWRDSEPLSLATTSCARSRRLGTQHSREDAREPGATFGPSIRRFGSRAAGTALRPMPVT